MNSETKSNGAASAPQPVKRQSFGSILEHFEKKSNATNSVYKAETTPPHSHASFISKPLKAKQFVADMLCKRS